MRTLRRCFRLAEEWALIPKAPVIHELPGKVNRERIITFEEEQKYLGAASATLRDTAILAVDTGLRPNSELFALEWANVHTDASAEGPHGHIHVSGGKTDAARRNVPLTPRAKAILEAWRARKVLSFYVFPGPGKGGHVVTIQRTSAPSRRAELTPSSSTAGGTPVGRAGRKLVWTSTPWRG